jgi:hypothetical protein
VTPSVIAAHAQATADHHQAVARAYGIPLRGVAPPTGPWRKAIRAAVDDIATRAVAFTPTMVSLRAAKLAGGRIYLLVMFADRGGEEGV